jgi:hypothetical protein
VQTPAATNGYGTTASIVEHYYSAISNPVTVKYVPKATTEDPIHPELNAMSPGCCRIHISSYDAFTDSDARLSECLTLKSSEQGDVARMRTARLA